jgi:hypothetical protein
VAFPDPSRLYDASGADAALIAHLSFWTGRDGVRIDRLMRQSKLVREKWDREDYLPRSICEVLARPGGVLTDKLPEPPPGPAAVGIEAPAPVRKAGNTFLGVDDQIGHFKGCVWVHSMNRVLTPGGYLEKPDQFRVTHGGYTFMMDNQNDRTTRDAWEAFTQSQALTVARADATCFKPAILPGAIVENAGRTYVNTWWPAKVARTVGDVTPFLEHLRKILPDDRDRKIYLSYMAACVQHVGKKFAWCPVLQGAEGNGKTLFSMCVAEAVGQHYTHWIDAAGLASPFNSFLANKVFFGGGGIAGGRASGRSHTPAVRHHHWWCRYADTGQGCRPNEHGNMLQLDGHIKLQECDTQDCRQCPALLPAVQRPAEQGRHCA